MSLSYQLAEQVGAAVERKGRTVTKTPSSRLRVPLPPPLQQRRAVRTAEIEAKERHGELWHQKKSSGMSSRDFPSLGAKNAEASGNGPSLRPHGDHGPPSREGMSFRPPRQMPYGAWLGSPQNQRLRQMGSSSRPATVKAEDIEKLEYEDEEGWAGQQQEVDYSAKLRFEDSDESDVEEDVTEKREDERKQKPHPRIMSEESKQVSVPFSAPRQAWEPLPSQQPASLPQWRSARSASPASVPSASQRGGFSRRNDGHDQGFRGDLGGRPHPILQARLEAEEHRRQARLAANQQQPVFKLLKKSSKEREEEVKRPPVRIMTREKSAEKEGEREKGDERVGNEDKVAAAAWEKKDESSRRQKLDSTDWPAASSGGEKKSKEDKQEEVIRKKTDGNEARKQKDGAGRRERERERKRGGSDRESQRRERPRERRRTGRDEWDEAADGVQDKVRRGQERKPSSVSGGQKRKTGEEKLGEVRTEKGGDRKQRESKEERAGSGKSKFRDAETTAEEKSQKVLQSQRGRSDSKRRVRNYDNEEYNYSTSGRRRRDNRYYDDYYYDDGYYDDGYYDDQSRTKKGRGGSGSAKAGGQLGPAPSQTSAKEKALGKEKGDKSDTKAAGLRKSRGDSLPSDEVFVEDSRNDGYKEADRKRLKESRRPESRQGREKKRIVEGEGERVRASGDGGSKRDLARGSGKRADRKEDWQRQGSESIEEKKDQRSKSSGERRPGEGRGDGGKRSRETYEKEKRNWDGSEPHSRGRGRGDGAGRGQRGPGQRGKKGPGRDSRKKDGGTESGDEKEESKSPRQSRRDPKRDPRDRSQGGGGSRSGGASGGSSGGGARSSAGQQKEQEKSAKQPNESGNGAGKKQESAAAKSKEWLANIDLTSAGVCVIDEFLKEESLSSTTSEDGFTEVKTRSAEQKERKEMLKRQQREEAERQRMEEKRNREERRALERKGKNVAAAAAASKSAAEELKSKVSRRSAPAQQAAATAASSGNSQWNASGRSQSDAVSRTDKVIRSPFDVKSPVAQLPGGVQKEKEKESKIDEVDARPKNPISRPVPDKTKSLSPTITEKLSPAPSPPPSQPSKPKKSDPVDLGKKGDVVAPPPSDDAILDNEAVVATSTRSTTETTTTASSQDISAIAYKVWHSSNDPTPTVTQQSASLHSSTAESRLTESTVLTTEGAIPPQSQPARNPSLAQEMGSLVHPALNTSFRMPVGQSFVRPQPPVPSHPPSHPPSSFAQHPHQSVVSPMSSSPAFGAYSEPFSTQYDHVPTPPPQHFAPYPPFPPPESAMRPPLNAPSFPPFYGAMGSKSPQPPPPPPPQAPRFPPQDSMTFMRQSPTEARYPYPPVYSGLSMDQLNQAKKATLMKFTPRLTDGDLVFPATSAQNPRYIPTIPPPTNLPELPESVKNASAEFYFESQHRSPGQSNLRSYSDQGYAGRLGGHQQRHRRSNMSHVSQRAPPDGADMNDTKVT